MNKELHQHDHEHHHEEECGCGHDHHHHDHDHDHHHGVSCGCGHDHIHHGSSIRKDLIAIGMGALLFAVGLILEHSIYNTLAVILPIFLVGYLILGWEVIWTALKNISRGQIFDENFLMSIATIAAFGIGDFAEGMGVMLFYRIGELFEHIAVEKSRTQIMDAVDMRPETVNLADGDTFRIIPAEDAKPGDILIVRPGDRIPLDGIVIDGESRIDTSPVTGEPVPVKAVAGTEVISGCVNEQGLLKMEVLKPLSESMVTKILDSVENAAAGKPRIDKFITKFAKVYTPIVVGLAVLTAIIPSLVSGNWDYWIETAITFLVISCPCALVISVPLAFFAGIGAASKLGILFKGGLSIEALKKVKVVVMDKTGTITKGNFAVQEVHTSGDLSEDELLAIAAACEASSTHPIAASILDFAGEKQLTVTKAENVEELSGMGIKASLPEGEALCGNKKLMERFNISMDSYQSDSAGTEVLIALNGSFAGYISISDTIKQDAVSAIANIKTSGLIPAMLTGDAESSALSVARETGIEKVCAQLMPDDKLTALKQLRDESGPVMFVGDGINDAPVLAGADVGAAMGTGADAAIEAADVVFMNSSVDAIPQSISIARATGSIAIQNVVLALAIKLIVILLGAVGLANIWAAVFADTGVAMLCILNSLRLLWKKF
ncbi:MAG: heavy metal translocating P-type ATPase [Bacillota bacterium]|nr:heavy metal translocating P-type ATPase [Bacillota bacterium]